MSKLAIIGGTGLSQINGLMITATQALKTPFGTPSAPFVLGSINGKEIVFLARHGNPHIIPPHKINYRANIWGLKELGVSEIIAVAAVGGITSVMAPAHIAIPDQIIDYSYGREHSYFAEDGNPVKHIDFSYPYDQTLRQKLIRSGKSLRLNCQAGGVYGCTQGPRLETTAEIIRMQRDGCALVGMTGMPEAALARELELPYACCAVIANWAAGKIKGEITMPEIIINLEQGMADVELLLQHFLTHPSL